MTLNLPTWLRGTLYVLTVVGTPVVLYLKQHGWIGDDELTLWGAEVTVVSAIAAFNTRSAEGPVEVTGPATVIPDADVDPDPEPQDENAVPAGGF